MENLRWFNFTRTVSETEKMLQLSFFLSCLLPLASRFNKNGELSNVQGDLLGFVCQVEYIKVAQ